MQTFVPYANCTHSAAVLDRLRLGKQRVEAYQIALTLTGQSTGWRNHPAVKMWRGYENALLYYGWVMCQEWIERGYRDSLQIKFIQMSLPGKVIFPQWWGDERVHVSHQSNLLRKAPNLYAQHFSVPDDMPYFWPV